MSTDILVPGDPRIEDKILSSKAPLDELLYQLRNPSPLLYDLRRHRIMPRRHCSISPHFFEVFLCSVESVI